MRVQCHGFCRNGKRCTNRSKNKTNFCGFHPPPAAAAAPSDVPCDAPSDAPSLCSPCDQEPSSSQYKKNFNSVLSQLLLTKHKKRKVCNGCHEIGHNINAKTCKLNIEKRESDKKKIKKYILSQDCLTEKTNDEYFVDLSEMLGISINTCRTLYEEIPPIELCDRKHDIKSYLQVIKQRTRLNCHQCNKDIYNIKKNTHRMWKGNTICDSCWSEHEVERNLLWEKIEKQITQCGICSSIKRNGAERYQYDHRNMFDKGNSIFSMVEQGETIDAINIEINKCQILCLSCHNIVSDIENKLGFTRIKQNLTRKLNNGEITKEEHTQQEIEIGEIYQKKMDELYNELKTEFIL